MTEQMPRVRWPKDKLGLDERLTEEEVEALDLACSRHQVSLQVVVSKPTVLLNWLGKHPNCATQIVQLSILLEAPVASDRPDRNEKWAPFFDQLANIAVNIKHLQVYWDQNHDTNELGSAPWFFEGFCKLNVQQSIKLAGFFDKRMAKVVEMNSGIVPTIRT